jgi:hypothetical protein
VAYERLRPTYSYLGWGGGLHEPIQRPYTRRTTGVRFRAEIWTVLFTSTTNTDQILKVADSCRMVAADKSDRSLRLTTYRHLVPVWHLGTLDDEEFDDCIRCSCLD